MMRSLLSPSPASGDLVITTLGMTSSLGAVTQACAAARAGLSRWAELDVDGMDDSEVQPEPLRGHAIRGFTNGFSGLGRFLRLGDAALSDLMEYGSLEPKDFARAHFLLHLPDDTYDVALFERYERPLMTAKEAESTLRKQRAEHVKYREQLAPKLMSELLSLHGIRSRPDVWSFSFGGPAGFVGCLLQAERLLTSRAAEYCVLGGIDSYVSGDTLEALHQLGLVQHGANPDGFFPGEAAAFLVVERFETARDRGARVEARVGAAAVTHEKHPRFSTTPSPSGLGLFQAIAAAHGRLGGAPFEPPLAIGNLNGSSYRANEFGHALIRMKSARLPIASRQWLPAESFGELGAATGPVALCMAVRAFARGYAQSPLALVWLTSDGDERGAFFLGDTKSRNGHTRDGGLR